MRQRITYLLPGDHEINPADIKFDEKELLYDYDVAEERRITLGLSDLPLELKAFLEEFHELHIRLVSNKNYKAFSPAVSRLPSGLHVFFTPTDPAAITKLCPELIGSLDHSVKCSAEYFSKPSLLSERFASAATYQFHHTSSNLPDIAQVLGLCPNASSAKTSPFCVILSAAKSASYIDYDYDAISHALDITIYWPYSSIKSAAKTFGSGNRLEVGILQSEKATEPEEISLGGFLTVLGEDDHPSPTLFSFPARHHPLDSSAFTANFQSPTGLHPKLDITFPPQSLHPPKDSCALHAYLTIPSFLFLDRYAFSDPLFLASQNLHALRSLSGEEDLEAPNWAVKQWGSAALFELSHPTPSSSNFTATIPLHLRYIKPHEETSLPWPVVFWACPAEEGLKMATNPFDRLNLGYEGLFGAKTMFYHVEPAGEELMLRLEVPRLEVEGEGGWVQVLTGVVALVGFGWVLWKSLTGGGEEREKKKKE